MQSEHVRARIALHTSFFPPKINFGHTKHHNQKELAKHRQSKANKRQTMAGPLSGKQSKAPGKAGPKKKHPFQPKATGKAKQDPTGPAAAWSILGRYGKLTSLFF